MALNLAQALARGPANETLCGLEQACNEAVEIAQMQRSSRRERNQPVPVNLGDDGVLSRRAFCDLILSECGEPMLSYLQRKQGGAFAGETPFDARQFAVIKRQISSGFQEICQQNFQTALEQVRSYMTTGRLTGVFASGVQLNCRMGQIGRDLLQRVVRSHVLAVTAYGHRPLDQSAMKRLIEAVAAEAGGSCLPSHLRDATHVFAPQSMHRAMAAWYNDVVCDRDLEEWASSSCELARNLGLHGEFFINSSRRLQEVSTALIRNQLDDLIPPQAQCRLDAVLIRGIEELTGGRADSKASLVEVFSEPQYKIWLVLRGVMEQVARSFESYRYVPEGSVYLSENMAPALNVIAILLRFAELAFLANGCGQVTARQIVHQNLERARCNRAGRFTKEDYGKQVLRSVVKFPEKVNSVAQFVSQPRVLSKPDAMKKLETSFSDLQKQGSFADGEAFETFQQQLVDVATVAKDIKVCGHWDSLQTLLDRIEDYGRDKANTTLQQAVVNVRDYLTKVVAKR